MRKPVVGVMGASLNDALTDSDAIRMQTIAESLGAALVRLDCILVTGATTGLPDLVAREFRKQGGFALGVSPAENQIEHVTRYGLPDDGADVIIYTGFGYKGRNVINVRSSEIVLIIGGATGTLNEFTIAYDEGKIIGVIAGSGGVADHIGEIVDNCRKATRAEIFFDEDPERLLVTCLAVLEQRTKARGK
jgi:uncharacterized protein (TIGR00725 family)